MPCILTITGENFDVDDFISKSNIVPYRKFYKGDPKYKTKPDGAKIERTGCSIDISKVEFENFNQQINDATVYLNQNKQKLQLINITEGIEYAVLDFGITHDPNNFVQSHYLSNEFLKLVSELGIGIELSVYQKTEDQSTMKT
jgi:hypothetical protein